MCVEHSSGHLVRFFADETDRVETVARFIRATLYTEDTCVIVAAPERCAAFRARLHAMDVDCTPLTARYQYVELDARTLLTHFLVDSHCDRPRFHQSFDTLIRQCSSRGKPVRIYGEMCDLLLSDGLLDAALEVEDWWNELSRGHEISTLCGYSQAALAALPDPTRSSERIRIRHNHAVRGRSD